MTDIIPQINLNETNIIILGRVEAGLSENRVSWNSLVNHHFYFPHDITIIWIYQISRQTHQIFAYLQPPSQEMLPQDLQDPLWPQPAE